MKPFKRNFLLTLALWLPWTALAQVDSGSNGHDGAFNPTQDVTVDMTDHPDGIYQYSSVNIPEGVTVTFKPNANNSPVIWLVQGDCSIGGYVDVGTNSPGGFPGGNASPAARPRAWRRPVYHKPQHGWKRILWHCRWSDLHPGSGWKCLWQRFHLAIAGRFRRRWPKQRNRRRRRGSHPHCYFWYAGSKWGYRCEWRRDLFK